MRTTLGLLLCSSSVLCAPALAQVTVSEDTTDPLETATIDAGAPGDITIDSGVTVSPETGTALTLNSSNTVSNSGTLTITDADNAVGVHILGGNTGSFTNIGAISILEDYTTTDSDEDGDIDTPDGQTGSGIAEGSGRVGILTEGASPFVGDITNQGSISVEGNDSYGVLQQADLQGSYISSVTDEDGVRDAGSIFVTGDRSIGYAQEGSVSGDVTLATVSVRGEDAQGVMIDGDIGGALVFEGGVSATGFRETGRRTFGDTIDLLDEDDLLTSGPTASVSASVDGGVLVSGRVGDETDTDEDGILDDVPPSGSILSYGDQAALLITTNDDDANEDIVIGAVAGSGGYGVVSRGAIRGQGINDDFDANGLIIEGNANESIDLAQGVLVGPLGEISATAYSGDATALRIGDNVSAPNITVQAVNQGTSRLDGIISASNNSLNRTDDLPTGDARPQIVAIDIAQTATAGTLVNEGEIYAFNVGTTDTGDDPNDTFDDTIVGRGDVFAVRDASGTLTTIENAGDIVASNADETGQNVALDLSNATADIALSQLRRASELYSEPTDEDPDADTLYFVGRRPDIVGQIILGAGNDSMNIQAGTIVGDIEFGAGADTLVLNSGTYIATDGTLTDETVEVTGAITDTDGQLSIDVIDGRLEFTNTGQINITSLNVASEGELVLTVDATQSDDIVATLIDASANVNFDTGAILDTTVTGLITDEVTVPIISAGALSLADGLDTLATDASFLYSATLSTSETDPNTLILNLRRLNADELGLDAAQAAAYEPLAAAANTDTEFASILSAASTQEEFALLYEQLLPDFSDANLRFAIAFHDLSSGAVGNRLNAVRQGREAAGSLWIQEAITYIDRDTEAANPGYRGYGLGFSAGIDRPVGPFYAVGLNVGGFSSQFETQRGYDEPLTYQSVTLGTYAASKLGPLLFDVHVGGGFDQYESIRNVQTSDIIEDTSFSRRATANWLGTHRVAGARIASPFGLLGLKFTPTVTADYVRIDEDGYTETGGDGINLSREERFMEMGSASATLDFGRKFENRLRQSYWQPSLRIGYREELFSTTGQTIAQTASGDPFVLDVTSTLGSGPTAGLSIMAGSEFSSFALNYDAVIRDGLLRHSGRATFRLEF